MKLDYFEMASQISKRLLKLITKPNNDCGNPQHVDNPSFLFPGYLTILRQAKTIQRKRGKKRKNGISNPSMRDANDYLNWNLEDDGREAIREWSRKRILKMDSGLNKSYYGCLVYTFHFAILKSFVENFNFMVIIQMIIAAGSVYLFDRYDLYYGFSASLFVSPIVFPLAFSINTDFQRREKVLDDLANFKSSSMLWFFCMREWKTGAGLSDEWMSSIRKKTHSIMFNLREYLLTSRKDRRNIIARYMYEDYSDTSQLIERIRDSDLPQNPALISRAYHLLNGLCLSFERLRVIREYRSPRSIRSFNKVLVLLLPIILCPYFVSLSREQGANKWGPYFMAVLVAAVFGALQGVQDKLDDPFDGMSEDDINLDTIDEWTFNSLENAAKRNFCKFGHSLVVDTDKQKSKADPTQQKPNVSEKEELKSKTIVELLQEIEKDKASKHHTSKNKKRWPSFYKRMNSQCSSKEDDEISLFLDDLNGEAFDHQNPAKVRKTSMRIREQNVSFSDETLPNSPTYYRYDEHADFDQYEVIQNGILHYGAKAMRRNDGEVDETPPLSPPSTLLLEEEKRSVVSNSELSSAGGIDGSLIKLNGEIAVKIKDSQELDILENITEKNENELDIFQEIIVVD